MKGALLVNTVLPTKVYMIYSANWRVLTEYPADNAFQALTMAREVFGSLCRTAVLKSKPPKLLCLKSS